MAVVDFRSGGFNGSHPQDRQAHGYRQDAEDYDDQMRDQQWDDADYDDTYGQTAQPPSMLGRLSRLTHYLGALISVGLIVVLAVWGFKLVVRDVSGVPVIRAVEGEARTAPENPGGELTDRMGLAVSSVAAGATGQATDQVAIAPTATGLQPQDVAMGVLGATVQEPSRAVELPPLDDAARVIATPDAEAARAAVAAAQSSVEPDSVENAVIADMPAAPEAPVNEALTDLSGQQTQDTAINQALAEANAEATTPPPAVAQSARPAPRPRRVASAATTAAAPAAPAAAESRPAAAPEAEAAPAAAKPASGAAMVQIGAFDSDALAKGEWDRVSGKFGGLFAGKARVVQEAQSGGRTFWRLRAGGFASKDEARRFCAALISEGVDCIPATAK